MATIYNGKHCVFEQVGVESNNITYNSSTNRDSDNAYNNYTISNVRNIILSSTFQKLSNVLQEVITNTTIQTATNGLNGTLVSTNDKVFLAAEKEMNSGERTYSVEQEFNALFTRSYWTTHTQDNDRKKYDTGNKIRSYRLRSPYSGGNNSAVRVFTTGGFTDNDASVTNRVSLCYAF